MDSDSIFYFAYGSNMLALRLSQRIGPFQILGAGEVPAYSLAFNKRSTDGSAKCNIEPSVPTDSVFGVIFKITKPQLEKLDRVEGVGGGYERNEITVACLLGHPIRAFTYIAERSHIAKNLPPYDWYRALVLKGARSNDLPPDYVSKSIQFIATATDPDSERAEKWWAIANSSD